MGNLMGIRVKMGQKIIGNYSWRRLLYTLCFVMFCVIDQRVKTGSGLDGVIETFREATGIVLACIIFSHYKWADFVKRKWIYLGCGIVSLLGGLGIFFWGKGRFYFTNDRIVILVNVLMWGQVIVHTFIKVAVEKEYPKLNKKMLAVWGVMMLLMIVSRSHYIWPLCYTMMFGCFYLTRFSKEEREDLLQGCLDGIFLGFILFQGFCCVFRPYDCFPRYVGIHNNSNLNALYYLAALAAVFSKILYLTKVNAHRWVKVIYWLASGTVLSFLFMTIGRAGWGVAFVMGLLFLGFWNVICQKKRFLQNGIVLILCFLLMFPISFSATRYLPPVFHHPIWFWGEWAEDKVHSWDPWDSVKYINMDRLLQEALGRITDSVQGWLQYSPFYMKADAAELPSADTPEIEEKQPGAPGQPIWQPGWKWDDVTVRGTIYKIYASRLNWWGHPYEEQGFQLVSDYWIGHAHNIYLQYGTDFGIPVLLLFIVLILWGGAVCVKRGKRKASIADIAAFFYILIPAVFGLVEYAWGVGSLSITMLFFAWGQAMRADEDAQDAHMQGVQA